MEKKSWLKCLRIYKGMFTDERVVEVNQHGSHANVFIVPATEVRGTVGEPGTVRVLLVAHDGGTWAIIPAPEQPMIPVQQTDLVAV